MKKNISIKEISELSGVSIATVSRVINQNGGYSEETEKRVKKIIKENNYEPNLLARSLRTNKVQIVGIVVPDITNEFFARVTLELQKNLFDLNYSTIICNTDELYDMEKRHLSMLRSQQVSGLIYISGEFGDNKNIIKTPTVYIDRKPPFYSSKSNCVLIESDNKLGGYLATKELLDRGCRHIALIAYKNIVSSHFERIKGYKQALQEYGLPANEDMIFNIDRVDVKEGYKKTKEILHSNVKVDGIFCSADLLAYGALNALDEEKILVPEHVRVIGFDDSSTSLMSRVSLTSIQQSIKEFGSLGATTLVSMINGNPLDKKQYILPVKLIRRSTT